LVNLASGRRRRPTTYAVSNVDRTGRLLLVQATGPSLEEDRLLRSDVADYHRAPTTKSGMNSTNLVTFPDGTKAYHKPFLGADPTLVADYDQSALSQSINECATWRLARFFGPPYDQLIPVTVLRYIKADAAAIRRDPDLKDGWGSLSHARSGRHYALPFAGEPDIVDQAAFIDSLIANQDRHPGQYRWDAARRQLSPLDHGFAFPKSAGRFNQSIFLEWRHNDGRAALSAEEFRLTRAVLDDPQMAGLRYFLLPEQIDVTERRLERMIRDAQVVEVSGR
jgi:hypothetical protein